MTGRVHLWVIEDRTWTSYNAAQSEEKHRFVELLSDLCNTIPQPEQAMGRPRLPLADMLFAAAYKVYVGFSARRFTSDLKDAQMRGLIGKAAHFNSVNRYMANPELTEALKNLATMSSLPLKAAESDFAVDSSGFSTSRFVRWYNKKDGREVDNRMWVKVHLMCGVNTKTVTSVEISGWTAHDTNYFVPLVEATAEHFQLRDVSADKAYLSRKNELWNYGFFGLRSTLAGFVGIAVFLVPLTLLIVVLRRYERFSAGLLVPYYVWVLYDLAWTYALWRLNGVP